MAPPQLSSFALRSVLEKDKLNETNFTNWYRNLRIVLRHDKKGHVIENPLPEELADNATAAVRNAYQRSCDESIEISCLMLAYMEPELQQQFENVEAFDMIETLKGMFQTQARTGRFNVWRSFLETKLKEGEPLSLHVIKLVGYTQSLEKLGFPLSQELATDTILASLPPSYAQFVQNYHMHGMEKKVTELHGMLKTAEEGIKKNTKQVLLKDKLKSNGSNFTDWFRNVRIILEATKKAYVFDAALGAEPATTESADLQKRFEHHSAYAMIGELNTLFQTQARAERYDASERFFNCKMEENSSVSEHVLRMSGYADRLRQLGIEIPNELGIDRVLQSLPPSYKSFVVNYNMQGMDRTLPQLLAMLKTAEVEIKKEHQVLMVNKTTSFKKAKGKKGNFKKGGKTVATPAKKPKSGPKPDTECFYCKGTGHWKRDCPKYLADKKAGNVKGEYLSYEFGTHLRQCGIVSQLTPPGTPQRNGVSERRNRTLLDMVRSMMSLTDLPLSFWGYALETSAFTLNRAPSKSVETTPYELWFGKKPKLSFLKVWGCEAYVKRLQPDKLEPKSEKCVFIGYPKETIGYTFYHRSEGKVFVAKNGSFLEKEFLSKEVSGRKVELDEVIEPSLEFECSAAPETVPVHPASAREEANDNDHEVLNETTTELRRSTRTRNTPEWYNVRVMNVMLLDNDEPANYEEAMMSPDSEKWLEAMKSEMGSMYENQVWTLVDLPNDRKAVENKWIFKKKTDADGNVTVYKARLVIKGFGFVQTHGEACIYKKVSGSSVAFLILYVDDILLIGNDIELLKSVKGYLNKSFSMKDLGEAAYILGIKIYRDDSESQSGYVFILNGGSIIRSITEFVDRYEGVTAERDKLRRDLERSQQELRSAQGLLCLSGFLPSSENSLDRVIDVAASVYSRAATGIQGASRVLTGLFGKMFPDEPVPESLGKLIEFFNADTDSLDEFSRVQTNSGAESTFVLALAHGIGEDVLRKVASGPPLLPSGEEVALTPYFQLGEELAAQLSAQLGSTTSEGEAAPPSSAPAPSQEVGQA
ncbi:uncharacterized protein LOC112269292 [Brachypodium distachyon]|uniref:uncharacterized protein LOC112269292 n=1 Tax=Brachypodium distachyon TaxID=15368 RepID=UPI000D0CFA17|nr:uncharacterized protein LOC112269292 [Brachypodium distachyon]|eukprot:XP_024311494.1 uncharacterized protein LOC112269292 [Brachypodium distachyon]